VEGDKPHTLGAPQRGRRIAYRFADTGVLPSELCPPKSGLSRNGRKEGRKEGRKGGGRKEEGRKEGRKEEGRKEEGRTKEGRKE
jgi:hypothetical protein